MVQKKRRIPRRREQIAARVAPYGEVPACVHAQKAVGEIALHGRGEGEEVAAVFY